MTTTEARVLGDWVDRQIRREQHMREASHLRTLASQHKAAGRLAAWSGALSRARAIEREWGQVGGRRV